MNRIDDIMTIAANLAIVIGVFWLIVIDHGNSCVFRFSREPAFFYQNPNTDSGLSPKPTFRQ